MKKINKNKFNSWKDYYFHYQHSLAEQFYIPLLKKINIKLKDKKIIDIGCGNGGFISAFLKHSNNLYGIEIKEFDWPSEVKSKIVFLTGDLTEMTDYKVAIVGQPADLIILRDVIEHIPINEKLFFLQKVKQFAKPDTDLLITFPPFYSPFGLHQQVFCKSILKYIPYLSILPKSILKLILLVFRENQNTLEKLLEIKECRMTIRNFIKIYKELKLEKTNSLFFTVRPSHTLRYGLKTRNSCLGKIPILRELFVTGVSFTLKFKK